MGVGSPWAGPIIEVHEASHCPPGVVVWVMGREPDELQPLASVPPASMASVANLGLDLHEQNEGCLPVV